MSVPTIDPRTLTCPACNAQPGQPCTQPTDTSRTPVRWYHVSRESRARSAYEAAGHAYVRDAEDWRGCDHRDGRGDRCGAAEELHQQTEEQA